MSSVFCLLQLSSLTLLSLCLPVNSVFFSKEYWIVKEEVDTQDIEASRRKWDLCWDASLALEKGFDAF